jgi:predicted component of type VI protein secretion system
MRRVSIALENGSSRLACAYLPENVPAIIGRGADADIRVGDRFVSRKHAELCWKNGVFLIRDLVSTNGTFVERVRLNGSQPREIADGAVIHFGSAGFYFCVGQVDEIASADATDPAVSDPTFRRTNRLAYPDVPRQVAADSDLTLDLVTENEVVIEGGYAQYAALSEGDAFVKTDKATALEPLAELPRADGFDMPSSPPLQPSLPRSAAPSIEPMRLSASSTNAASASSPLGTSFRSTSVSNGATGQALARALRPSPSATPPLPHLETSGVPGRGEAVDDPTLDDLFHKGRAVVMPNESLRALEEMRNQIGAIVRSLPITSEPLEWLRAGFEYRRKIPFLGEAKDPAGVGGLVIALKNALSCFGAPAEDTSRATLSPVPLDEDFKAKMCEAINSVPLSAINALHYRIHSRKLDWRDSQVSHKVVLTSFTEYGLRATFGTSPDIW